jgi:hypothetical protein
MREVTMYVEQCLARNRNAELLSRASDARRAHGAAELGRLERRRARAERHLLHAWKRVDQLRSTLGSAG